MVDLKVFGVIESVLLWLRMPAGWLYTDLLYWQFGPKRL